MPISLIMPTYMSSLIQDIYSIAELSKTVKEFAIYYLLTYLTGLNNPYDEFRFAFRASTNDPDYFHVVGEIIQFFVCTYTEIKANTYRTKDLT